MGKDLSNLNQVYGPSLYRFRFCLMVEPFIVLNAKVWGSFIEESVSLRALHSQKKKKKNEILVPLYFHIRLNL